MPTLSLLAQTAPLTALFAALAASLLFTPLVVRLAERLGWVAQPTSDRWHERATALMGGIAIAAALGAGWALAVREPAVAWIAGGAALLFVAGFVDDRRGISPPAKLGVQVAAAGLLLLAGYRLEPAWAPWISLPLTFVWVIGVTNAFNLLDNMDGLAAGVAGIAATFLALLAAMQGQAGLAAAALAVTGATAGFLVYNFKPARIFMGDCGSLPLGYVLAALALVFPARSGSLSLAALLLVPAAVMAVPILDTTLVTLKRMLVGRSVSQGGADHTSHRLVALGLSEQRAVLTLWAVAAAFGALALAFRRFDVMLTWGLVVYAAVGLAIFGAFLASLQVYGDEQEERGRRRIAGRVEEDHVLLRAMLRHRRQLVGAVVDLALIGASLTLAYWLRFEEGALVGEADTLMRALPVALAAKLAVFHLFGLYRGLWRYVDSHELLRTVQASAVGSAVTVLALLALYRFEGFSRSVFAIDFLLTTVSLVGARGAFRWLRSYFAGRRIRGRRVLIYGAGDAGSLALREIRMNPRAGLLPVGFIDDDPAKHGRALHGLPVVGGHEDLPAYRWRHDADLVIVAIGSIDPSRRIELMRACLDAGLDCTTFDLSFGPVLRPGQDAARPSVVA